MFFFTPQIETITHITISQKDNEFLVIKITSTEIFDIPILEIYYKTPEFFYVKCYYFHYKIVDNNIVYIYIAYDDEIFQKYLYSKNIEKDTFLNRNQRQPYDGFFYINPRNHEVTVNKLYNAYPIICFNLDTEPQHVLSIDYISTDNICNIVSEIIYPMQSIQKEIIILIPPHVYEYIHLLTSNTDMVVYEQNKEFFVKFLFEYHRRNVLQMIYQPHDTVVQKKISFFINDLPFENQEDLYKYLWHTTTNAYIYHNYKDIVEICLNKIPDNFSLKHSIQLNNQLYKILEFHITYQQHLECHIKCVLWADNIPNLNNYIQIPEKDNRVLWDEIFHISDEGNISIKKNFLKIDYIIYKCQ
jgi:hypothetical protein